MIQRHNDGTGYFTYKKCFSTYLTCFHWTLGDTNAEIDDDHDPSQCHLFAKNTCKYIHKTSNKVQWIQCDVMSCHLWYHFECAGIVSQPADDFLFNCPLHKSTGDLAYRKRFELQSSQLQKEAGNSLVDATSSVVSPKQRKSIPSINRPNYVEYEGNV